MVAIESAKSSLAHCEKELRRAASGALNAGDYTAARTVLSLAETIAEHRARLDRDDDKQDAAAPETARTRASANSRNAKPQIAPKPTRRTKPGSYPRFIRRDDKLIKIGWSKRNKQEYEHKAPGSVVFAIAGHLRTHTRDGKLFTVNDMLPVPDPEQGGELPSYQVYLALAWLRSAGAISKHGRDGYAPDHARLTEKAMANQWDALSSEDI